MEQQNGNPINTSEPSTSVEPLAATTPKKPRKPRHPQGRNSKNRQNSEQQQTSQSDNPNQLYEKMKKNGCSTNVYQLSSDIVEKLQSLELLRDDAIISVTPNPPSSTGGAAPSSARNSRRTVKPKPKPPISFENSQNFMTELQKSAKANAMNNKNKKKNQSNTPKIVPQNKDAKRNNDSLPSSMIQGQPIRILNNPNRMTHDQNTHGRALLTASGAELLRVGFKPRILNIDGFWEFPRAKWFEEFERRILNKQMAFQNVVHGYKVPDFNLLYSIIFAYFEQLQASIDGERLDCFHFVYQQRPFDFAALENRFVEFLDFLGFFEKQEMARFKMTLGAYDINLPANVKYARTFLLQIRHKLLVDKSRLSKKNDSFYDKNFFNNQFWWRKDGCLMLDSVEKVLSPKCFAFDVKSAKNISKKVKSLPTAEEKLQCAIKEISLSAESESRLLEVVDSIQKIIDNSELAQFKPEVHIFGSLGSGLGTFDSDIDLYIRFGLLDELLVGDFFVAILILQNLLLILQRDFGVKDFDDALIFSQRCPIVKLPFNKCFPHISGIVKGLRKQGRRRQRVDAYKGKKNLLKPDAEAQALSASSQSSECSEDEDCSKETPQFSQDEMPVQETENILHQMIGWSFASCDISLKNMFGVYNSKFIRFLTTFDRRFFEMTILLKYWGKQLQLIGKNRVTSYGLNMMAIFFLQNQSPPILPSVETLQQLAKQQGKPEIVIQGHHFEFCDDLSIIPRTENTKTSLELIVEFFKFYSTFDFYNYVIRPRTGEPISRIALFEEKTKKGECNFCWDTFICIEDPFVSEHNCGRAFRSSQIDIWYKIFNQYSAAITTENCVDMLVNPSKVKPLFNIIHMPFTLFSQRLALNHNETKIVPLKKASSVDFKASILMVCNIIKWVVDFLLEDHFHFSPNCYRLETKENGGFELFADFEFIECLYKFPQYRKLLHDCNFQYRLRKAEEFLRPIETIKSLENSVQHRGLRPNRDRVGREFNSILKISWIHTNDLEVPRFQIDVGSRNSAASTNSGETASCADSNISDAQTSSTSKLEEPSKKPRMNGNNRRNGGKDRNNQKIDPVEYKVSGLRNVIHFFLNEIFYRFDSSEKISSEFYSEFFKPTGTKTLKK